MRSSGLFLAAAMFGLAACSVNPPTPLPEAADPEDWLPSLPPTEILLQYDSEPTFSVPQFIWPFGRVPPFTLYADGTAVYLRQGNRSEGQQVIIAKLTLQETADLVRQVQDSGFHLLQDQLEMCRQMENGDTLCVADAAFTILSGRLADGTSKTVRIYADLTEFPKALSRVRSVMLDFSHPAATPYSPAKASLFFQYAGEAADREALDWPLDPAWIIQEPFSQGDFVRVIEGENLASLIEATALNNGRFLVRARGHLFHMHLVPWLPYADHNADLIGFDGYAPGP